MPKRTEITEPGVIDQRVDVETARRHLCSSLFGGAGLAEVLNENLYAHPVLACSVCVGDPNSAMYHGAQAGVAVMLGVVVTVLTAFASLIVFWMRRAAKYEALEEAQPLRCVSRSPVPGA